jgi:hypothetical protein
VSSEQIAAAMKKAGLLWLSWGDGPSRPAWFSTVDESYVVLAGRGSDDEQPLPGLAEAGQVEVVVPAKPALTRLLRWTATVRVLEPGSEEWTAAAHALRSDRLNADDLPGQLDRWQQTADLVVREPAGPIAEQEGRYDDRPYAPPPPTPAVTRGRLPRVLHRRTRRHPSLVLRRRSRD